MSAHSPTSSCVTSSTTSQSREQPHPAVRRLRAQPEVLHGAVSLGDQHDPLAELRELRHDPLRQVRLPGARHAGEEQALPLQAAGSSTWIGGSASNRGSLYSLSRRFTSSNQILRRAVPVPVPGERLHVLQKFPGQVLEDEAVGLDRRKKICWY